jgi:DNA replication protein DnaC
METMAQLKSALKELRLKSFADNLEMRNMDAIKSKMSYIDFLLALCQDEIDKRRFKKKEMRIKKANLGRFKNIREFDFDFNPDINRKLVMELAGCMFINKSENIIITGPAGVGKTCIAKSIAVEACHKGYKVLFTRTSRMLEYIYSGKADATYQKKMDSFIKPELLILDDWGMTPFNEVMLNIINEIISERYEKGSMIITSNRPISKWSQLFNEPVISSALLDRLFHNAHKIIIPAKAKSYRQIRN